MKIIKYEFLKTIKVKDKSNKIWTYKSNFAEELLVMFLTRLQKIVKKLKSLSIN